MGKLGGVSDHRGGIVVHWRGPSLGHGNLIGASRGNIPLLAIPRPMCHGSTDTTFSRFSGGTENRKVSLLPTHPTWHLYPSHILHWSGPTWGKWLCICPSESMPSLWSTFLADRVPRRTHVPEDADEDGGHEEQVSAPSELPSPPRMPLLGLTPPPLAWVDTFSSSRPWTAIWPLDPKSSSMSILFNQRVPLPLR